MEKISMRKMTPEEVENSGISSWPIWAKEVSRFKKHYNFP